MKNLINSMKEHFASFEKDAVSQLEKGNKTAGTRARKVSLAIEKTLKEFRKKSIEVSRK